MKILNIIWNRISSFFHNLIMLWIDIRSIRECKATLKENLDRKSDENDTLRLLTIAAVNALFWERYKATKNLKK
jgi:RNase adaptor protein for sRNA GlmZ degradation